MKLHFESRKKASALEYALMSFISLFLIIGILVIVFLAVGSNPLKALSGICTTAFQSPYYFSEALVRATPLIFTSLAVAVCLKMRLWNIGAEGQLFMGAFGAVLVEQTCTNFPSLVLIPLMIMSAIICGAFYGEIVGILKRALNVNETLTSLLLNYVATAWMDYLIYGPWRDPSNPGFPITKPFVRTAYLPQMFGTRLHAGFILAIATALFIWYMMEKTTFGYETRAIGASFEGARYSGIPVKRNIVIIFILAGALAALAGFSEVAGLHHKLQPGNVSNNYGSYGIIIAWLSNANPLIIILGSILGGILLVGAEGLQVSMGIASENVQIIIGLLLVSILVCKFFMSHKIIATKVRKEK